MKKLFLSLTFSLLAVMNIYADSEVIAHRGYWKANGSTQNSRASLQKALDLNIFGSEIDIWLTADGKLVVNHDTEYQGVKIQSAKYKDCKNLILKNGERMPQLKDLLKMMKETKSRTKLIIEIKSHETLEANQEAAREAVEAVKKYGVANQVEYISFNFDTCKELVKVDPNAQVAYLNGDKTPTELHQIGITGIDYHIKVIRQHPEWIQEAQGLGMKVNVWTVNKKEDIQEMSKAGVDYITTDEPELAVQLTK